MASYFIPAGYVAVDLVVMDKSESKMHSMKAGKPIRIYHVSLGANPEGYKQRKGEEITPEGNYVLGYKNENSSLYRALHIYPNSDYRHRAEGQGVSPDGFIMAHGQKNEFGWISEIT